MNAILICCTVLSMLAPQGDPPAAGIHQLLGGPAHTGGYATTGPAVGPGGGPAVAWSVTVKGGITVQPLLVDGVLYLATDEGWVHALDAATGATKWKVKAAEKMIASTPAWADGLILVTGHDKHLRAIDAATGAARWKVETDEKALAAPTVSGGVVYFTSYDGRLRAVDVKTGKVRWTYIIGEVTRERAYGGGWDTQTVELSASPAVVNGVVYVARRNAILAVDATRGTLLWRLEEDYGGADAPTVVADGILYQGTEHGLLAVDAKTGKKLWRWGSKTVMAAPAIHGGVAYVLDWDKELTALDAKTSKWLWSVPLDHGQESSPVFVDGRLYVGSDCAAVAIDPTKGDRLWTFDPDAGAVRSTPVLQDGVYYGATWAGTIFALK
jgi:outer membrane protein assembly factor BamB